jgi:hypothetical protein
MASTICHKANIRQRLMAASQLGGYLIRRTSGPLSRDFPEARLSGFLTLACASASFASLSDSRRGLTALIAALDPPHR